MNLEELNKFYFQTGSWERTYYCGIQTLKYPQDLWIMQEILWECRPDVVIELGTHHGGSALYLAHVLDAIGKGIVLTVDCVKMDRRNHRRIRYLHGKSPSLLILSALAEYPGSKMLIHDADHRKEAVLRDLEYYANLVTPGQYLIVEDTICDTPALPNFGEGPEKALQEWLPKHPEFEVDGSRNKFPISTNPGGYLKKEKMNCKLCGEADTVYLWDDADGGHWYRCLHCGSDSSSWRYEQVKGMYDASYIERQIRIHCGGSVESGAEKMRTNFDLFDTHKRLIRGKDFLDVGSNEGSALYGMQQRGWSVHGWDCNPAAYLGTHTTISDTFTAKQFPQRYDAILCREVIEHNPHPKQLIAEMAKALKSPGLLQVQTPRPSKECHQFQYQQAHLFLMSPIWLLHLLLDVGLKLVDVKFWDIGQAYLCRRV